MKCQDEVRLFVEHFAVSYGASRTTNTPISRKFTNREAQSLSFFSSNLVSASSSTMDDFSAHRELGYSSSYSSPIVPVSITANQYAHRIEDSYLGSL